MSRQVIEAASTVRDTGLPARPRISRKPLLVSLAGLAALGAAWDGHDWWTERRFIESTDDAYVGGDVTVIAPKVAGAHATLANLAAGRRLQAAVISQTQAELAATGAEITRARLDMDRYHTLSRDQFASAQRFQQTDADNRKALAADQKARASVDATTRELDVIDTQV